VFVSVSYIYMQYQCILTSILRVIIIIDEEPGAFLADPCEAYVNYAYNSIYSVYLHEDK